LKELLRFPFWLLSRPFVWIGRLLRSFRFWVLVILAVIVLLVAYYAAADRYTPFTTDAYVQAYVVQVAPQVAGRVVAVHVEEGSRVPKGSLLFEVDPRPFEHKVALLEAKLAEARQQVKQMDAELSAARAEHERLEAEAAYAAVVYKQEELIYKKESTTERRYLDALQKHRASQAALGRSASLVQQAQDALNARIGEEHAIVAQVQAELAEARLNLSYTRVYAPCDSIITNLQLREGDYAHVGQAVLACIDTQTWLIVAQLQENSLVLLKPGQPALVALRGSPGQLLPARVDTVGWGVGQGQGVPSGMLPEVQDRSAWVQPSQRFQVRLRLDDDTAVPLRVGMTCSVSVYVEPAGTLNDITRGIHQIVAWFYYL
jgi:multidrug resistance efflux pump